MNFTVNNDISDHCSIISMFEFVAADTERCKIIKHIDFVQLHQRIAIEFNDLSIFETLDVNASPLLDIWNKRYNSLFRKQPNKKRQKKLREHNFSLSISYYLQIYIIFSELVKKCK